MLFVKVRLTNIFAFLVKIVKEVTFLKKKDKIDFTFFSKNSKRTDVSYCLGYFFSASHQKQSLLQESISYLKVISLPWAPGRLNHKRSCYCLDVVATLVKTNTILLSEILEMCRKLEKKVRQHFQFFFYLHFYISSSCRRHFRFHDVTDQMSFASTAITWSHNFQVNSAFWQR